MKSKTFIFQTLSVMTGPVSVVLLLTLACVVTAHDNCGKYEDYLCGDVCIDQAAECHCGGQIVERYREAEQAEDHSYCCTLPAEDVRKR